MSNLQKNPNDLGKYMTDQRVMAAFGVLLGIPIQTTNFSGIIFLIIKKNER